MDGSLRKVASSRSLPQTVSDGIVLASIVMTPRRGASAMAGGLARALLNQRVGFGRVRCRP